MIKKTIIDSTEDLGVSKQALYKLIRQWKDNNCRPDFDNCLFTIKVKKEKVKGIIIAGKPFIYFSNSSSSTNKKDKPKK